MVSTVDSVTVTVTTEPPGPVVDGPVSSWTSWGGDDIRYLELSNGGKPGPVMVSTVDSGNSTVTTEPPGPVGLVDGPVGSVAGPVGEVMTLVPGVK